MEVGEEANSGAAGGSSRREEYERVVLTRSQVLHRGLLPAAASVAVEAVKRGWNEGKSRPSDRLRAVVCAGERVHWEQVLPVLPDLPPQATAALTPSPLNLPESSTPRQLSNLANKSRQRSRVRSTFTNSLFPSQHGCSSGMPPLSAPPTPSSSPTPSPTSSTSPPASSPSPSRPAAQRLGGPLPRRAAKPRRQSRDGAPGSRAPRARAIGCLAGVWFTILWRWRWGRAGWRALLGGCMRWGRRGMWRCGIGWGR